MKTIAYVSYVEPGDKTEHGYVNGVCLLLEKRKCQNCTMDNEGI